MYAMYGVYVMYAMYGMYAMHGKHTQCTCVCVTCRHSHSFKITHRTHSCALTYKTRAVICWGERAHGRLDSPPASPSSSSYPPPPPPLQRPRALGHGRQPARALFRSAQENRQAIPNVGHCSHQRRFSIQSSKMPEPPLETSAGRVRVRVRECEGGGLRGRQLAPRDPGARPADG